MTITCGDVTQVLPTLPDGCVQCCITSPPYWGLRDYGVEGQLGLEPTTGEYVEKMVAVFREVRRALRDDGTLWLVLGDSYAGGGRACDTDKQRSNKGTINMPPGIVPPGLKPKDLVGIPWRVAFALQADGWYLRSDIIWSKPNPMPESVRDRPTKAHEYVFLLTKSAKYYFDQEAVREQGIYTGLPDRKLYDAKWGSDHDQQAFKVMNGRRNIRSVWTIPTQPYPEAHFATFPEALVEKCLLAGSAEGDTVLDPFMGSGTVALVAVKHRRNYIGIEFNPEYVELANRRLEKVQVKLL